jgi:hypothetical protein
VSGVVKFCLWARISHVMIWGRSLLTGIEHFYKSMSVASFEGVTLPDIHFYADLTCPKACMLHISFRCVPLQDIHIYSLGYVYWQFFMSLTVILVVHNSLLV